MAAGIAHGHWLGIVKAKCLTEYVGFDERRYYA